MHLSTDEIILWQHGAIKLNATIATTWGLMFILVVGAKYITRNISNGQGDASHARTPHLNPAPRPTAGFAQPADSYGGKRAFRNTVFVPKGEEANESLRDFHVYEVQVSRWQSLLEIIVISIRNQIGEVGLRRPENYLGFIGTLFLYIATANLFTVFPVYEPPTGSLSTTTALALLVFVAVPFYAIRERGLPGYLKTFAEPTLVMLPFNIISELSHTLALAVRLFGNMMSGTMILAILLIVTPFIFPMLMNVLGLLTGMVQAYIFSVLATVFIAAASGTPDTTTGDNHG